MRNTVMQERLADVLSHSQIRDALYEHRRDGNIIVASAKTTRRNILKIDHKKNKAASASSPSISPPEQSNPFIVHPHPASALEEDLRAEAAYPRVASASEDKNPEAGEEKIPLIPATAPEKAPPDPAAQSTGVSPADYPPELSGMVARYRTAKSALIFTLEQLNARRGKTEAELAARRQELEGIDREITKTRENIHRIDETIAASALLAEQAATIDPRLLGHGAHHKAERPAMRSARWNLDDSSVCRQQDVLEIVNAHPGIDLKASDVRKRLPAAKQAHGQNTVIAAMLSNLVKENKIARVGRGDYRALNS